MKRAIGLVAVAASITALMFLAMTVALFLPHWFAPALTLPQPLATVQCEGCNFHLAIRYGETLTCDFCGSLHRCDSLGRHTLVAKTQPPPTREELREGFLKAKRLSDDPRYVAAFTNAEQDEYSVDEIQLDETYRVLCLHWAFRGTFTIAGEAPQTHLFLFKAGVCLFPRWGTRYEPSSI